MVLVPAQLQAPILIEDAMMKARYKQSISAPALPRSAAPGALRGSHSERRSDSAPGQPFGAALRQRSDPWSASAPIALQQKLFHFSTLFSTPIPRNPTSHMLASVLI